VTAGGSTLRDRRSSTVRSIGTGLRLVNLSKGVGVDLIYVHPFVKDNGRRGFDLVGFEDSIRITGGTIVSNGTDGIAIMDTHALIETSLICFNGNDGIHVEGDASDVTASAENIIDENGAFEIRNLSPNPVDARDDNWGPTLASEMDQKGFPANISDLVDVFDVPGEGLIDYRGWDRPGCEPEVPTTTSSTTSTTSTETTISTATSMPTS